MEIIMYTCIIDTPLGAMRAAAKTAASPEGTAALTGLWFIGQRYYPEKIEAWIDGS